MKECLVIDEPADAGGWGAYTPDIDGVVALSGTLEETKALMREALAAHVAFLRDAGRVVPEPRTAAERIAA